MIRGAIDVAVGVPVLDELFYRLLLARVRDATGQNPLNVLRTDLVNTIAAHAPVIEHALRRLVALPHFHLVGVEASDLDGMLRNITAFSLLPRDALHLALLQRLGLDAIASDDTDFDRVPGLDRHWIINPP